MQIPVGPDKTCSKGTYEALAYPIGNRKYALILMVVSSRIRGNGKVLTAPRSLCAVDWTRNAVPQESCLPARPPARPPVTRKAIIASPRGGEDEGRN